MFNNALTIAQRTVTQLVHDRRTMALLIIAPLLIASLVGVSTPDKRLLDNLAPAILATLAIFFGFLLSGISFLRERSQGTLERLMASPVTKMDIVGGYLMGFLVFAIIQTLIIFFYMIYVLNIGFNGELWQIVIFQVLISILAVCLGIFASIFAKNEFQMVQFIPIIILPQLFLCGLLWPISSMPDYLQWIADFLPLTYGIEGMRGLMVQGQSLLDVIKDVGILAAYAAVLMVLAAFSTKRA